MHNLEAEQQILGAILANNEAANHCEGLEPQHFHNPLNRTLFEAIQQIMAEGKIANPIMLKGHAESKYLASLMGYATSISNINQYAAKVIDLANQRRIRDICLHGSTLTGTADEMLEAIEPQLFAVGQNKKGEYVHVSQPAEEVVERAEKAYKNVGRLTGLDTGFAELNKTIGGWQKSDLVIIAGRPSMGKTALAVNSGKHAATKTHEAGKMVGLFSLEMSKVQLTQRMISSESGISSQDIQAGRFNAEQFQAIVDAKNRVSALNMIIDDTPALSVAQLRARARRMKRKGCDLIIVDYLQLMAGGSGNRVTDVTEITQGLKAIAKELDIPVIALSQLSRAVEQREDKRPQLSDLRESGSIEQDADIVMFVYREEYYIDRAKPEDGGAKYIDWLTKKEASAGKAELMIAKHRNGAIANIPLTFKGETTTFSDRKDNAIYSHGRE